MLTGCVLLQARQGNQELPSDREKLLVASLAAAEDQVSNLQSLLQQYTRAGPTGEMRLSLGCSTAVLM